MNRFLGIEDANLRGGARPALGDISGDERADLVVAAGILGDPRIAVFDGAARFAVGYSPIWMRPGGRRWQTFSPGVTYCGEASGLLCGTQTGTDGQTL